MNPAAPISPRTPTGGNWIERNWFWFVPAGCLGLVFLFAAFFGGIFVLVVATIRHSWVYEEAVERARAHPAVIRELGEPIRTGWWILGNLQSSGTSGRAELTIPISGPRDSARVFVEAGKRDGAWEFDYLVVEIDGSGEVIDLLPGDSERIQTAGRRPAPPFPPRTEVGGRGVLTGSGRFGTLIGSVHSRNTVDSEPRRGVS